MHQDCFYVMSSIVLVAGIDGSTPPTAPPGSLPAALERHLVEQVADCKTRAQVETTLGAAAGRSDSNIIKVIMQIKYLADCCDIVATPNSLKVPRLTDVEV